MTINSRPHTHLTPEEFELFRDWIHAHSGIFLEDSKVDSLRVSLAERAARFDARDYREYFQRLSEDEQEFKSLLDLVTINETSFFRFPAQFDALRQHVVPEILSHLPANRPRRFSAWSAGCSTGEEPYTLAIALLETGMLTPADYVEVLGTDVSPRALDIASAAEYPERALSTVPKQARERWFEPHQDGFRPVEEVRRLVRLRYHNLARDTPPPSVVGGFDVIFCRNVTIYFSLESTRRLIDGFFDALSPGGYLFVGHSETLTSVSDRFEAIETGGVFLYRRPRERRVHGIPRTDVADPASRDYRNRRHSTPRSAETDSTGCRAAVSDPTPDPLARAYESLESAQPAQALQIALALVATDPDNQDARLVTAFAYADLGQLDEAAAQASLTLAANPLSAPAHYVLGVIRREQGDVEGSLVEFRRTLYAERDFVLAHFAIATIERRRGNLLEAAREYDNTLRALRARPVGSWTAFLGGFTNELLTATCQRGLVECERGATRR